MFFDDQCEMFILVWKIIGAILERCRKRATKLMEFKCEQKRKKLTVVLHLCEHSNTFFNILNDYKFFVVEFFFSNGASPKNYLR